MQMVFRRGDLNFVRSLSVTWADGFVASSCLNSLPAESWMATFEIQGLVVTAIDAEPNDFDGRILRRDKTW
jgi:hypothetical protein